MFEPKVNNDILLCICGQTTNFTTVVEDISERMFDFGNNHHYSVEKINCDNCDRSFNVSVDATASFHYDTNIIDENTPYEVYKDKNQKEFEGSYFSDLQLNDNVSHIWDGEYLHDNMIYKVIDGKISYILSAEIDPNQLCFDDVVLNGGV